MAAESSSPSLCFSHVYDNVGLKANRHIYENPGELSDVTPDLILAVKPKVPLQEEGQVSRFSHTSTHEKHKYVKVYHSYLDMCSGAVVHKHGH